MGAVGTSVNGRMCIYKKNGLITEWKYSKFSVTRNEGLRPKPLQILSLSCTGELVTTSDFGVNQGWFTWEVGGNSLTLWWSNFFIVRRCTYTPNTFIISFPLSLPPSLHVLTFVCTSLFHPSIIFMDTRVCFEAIMLFLFLCSSEDYSLWGSGERESDWFSYLADINEHILNRMSVWFGHCPVCWSTTQRECPPCFPISADFENSVLAPSQTLWV